jgi:hypothetical protein
MNIFNFVLKFGSIQYAILNSKVPTIYIRPTYSGTVPVYSKSVCRTSVLLSSYVPQVSVACPLLRGYTSRAVCSVHSCASLRSYLVEWPC